MIRNNVSNVTYLLRVGQRPLGRREELPGLRYAPHADEVLHEAGDHAFDLRLRSELKKWIEY